MNILTIYSDGGSRGNPGRASYGFIVYDHNTTVLHEEGRVIGITTNNIAEYTGIVKALEWVQKQKSYTVDAITFKLDSELAVKQLTNRYRVKSTQLQSLFYKVKELEYALAIPITYTHVRREFNKEADRLVNEALDS